MTNALFVHGAGVRALAFDRTFRALKAHGGRRLPSDDFQARLWGETLGAKLNCDGASIPTYDASISGDRLDVRGRRSHEETRWSLLYEHPLQEIVR
jgi:hypothetical protein